MANHKLSIDTLKTPVSFRWTVPLKEAKQIYPLRHYVSIRQLPYENVMMYFIIMITSYHDEIAVISWYNIFHIFKYQYYAITWHCQRRQRYPERCKHDNDTTFFILKTLFVGF
jgi:hypothetical protein